MEKIQRKSFKALNTPVSSTIHGLEVLYKAGLTERFWSTEPTLAHAAMFAWQCQSLVEANRGINFQLPMTGFGGQSDMIRRAGLFCNEYPLQKEIMSMYVTFYHKVYRHYIPGMELIALTWEVLKYLETFSDCLDYVEEIHANLSTTPSFAQIRQYLNPEYAQEDIEQVAVWEGTPQAQVPPETVAVNSYQEAREIGKERPALSPKPMVIEPFYKAVDYRDTVRGSERSFYPGFRVTLQNYTKRTVYAGDRRGLVWAITPSHSENKALDGHVVVGYEGQMGGKYATVEDTSPERSQLVTSKDADPHLTHLYKPRDNAYVYLNTKLISETVLAKAQQHHGVYEPYHDVMVSFVREKAIHPHAMASVTHQLTTYPSQGPLAGVSFLLVDNEGRLETRYFKVFGQVFQLVPTKHSVLPDGLYMVSQSSKPDGRTLATTTCDILPLEEMHKKIKTFPTYEEARDNMPLEDIEQARDREKKRHKELQQIEDRHAHEMRVLKEKADALQVERQQRQEMELRLADLEREKQQLKYQYEKSLSELKLENERTKNEFAVRQQEQKIEGERTMFSMDLEAQRMKEQMVLDHKRLIMHMDEYERKRESEERRRRQERDDYYDERSQKRKDTAEAIKGTVAIAGGLLGAATFAKTVYDHQQKKKKEEEQLFDLLDDPSSILDTIRDLF